MHRFQSREFAGAGLRGRFDPIAEGALYGLSPEVSLHIWDHICDERARQRFHQVAAQVAGAPGALTRVDAEARGAELDGEVVGDIAPGKVTRVEAAVRRHGARRRGGGPVVAALAGDETALDEFRVTGGGEPVPAPARGVVAAAAGGDVDRIRVHRGGAADRLATEAEAHAYTIGHDIVLGAGVDLGTSPGLHLLAHEAAHVAQQRASGQPRMQRRARDESPQTADEVDADRAADAATDPEAAAKSEHLIDETLAIMDSIRTELLPTFEIAVAERDVEEARDAAAGLRTALADADDRVEQIAQLGDPVIGYLRLPMLRSGLDHLRREVETALELEPPIAASSAAPPYESDNASVVPDEDDEAAWAEDQEAIALVEWHAKLDRREHARQTAAVAPDAFSGIKLHLQVRDALPPTDQIGSTKAGPGQAGPYDLWPRVVSGQVHHYLAYHRERQSTEWVVGPDAVDTFAADVELYVGAARAALPGSKLLPETQADGAEKAPHLPSVVELGAFGAVPEVIDFATQGNGGSALVAARNAHIRLDLYAKEAKRLALELKAEVEAGTIDHLDARRQAVEGRNHLLHAAREKLSPAARYTSEKLKEDGASVDALTKKKVGDVLDASLDRPRRPGADPSKAMAVLGESGDAAQLRAALAEDSALWERYQLALEAGDDAKQVYGAALRELGEQPAVSKAVITSAGKTNSTVTKVARYSRAAGTVAGAIGVIDMITTIADADEGQRWHVAGREFSAFAGGVIGAEVGAAAGVATATWVASLVATGGASAPVLLAVSLIGGFVGGAVGANVGPTAFDAGAQLIHTGLAATLGPGSAQTGGYPGLHQRSQHYGSKQQDLDWLIEDAIFRMDGVLKELEGKIEEAPLRDELEALQKARLDLLTEREQMGAVLLAFRSGALDEGAVWDMFGQRPEGR